MGRLFVIRKSRVFLEEQGLACAGSISLKLCVGRQIFKFPNQFIWTQACHRWDGSPKIQFECIADMPVELEFYLMKNELPYVLGEGKIIPTVLTNHLHQEVKLLSYDGLVAGWLYCEFAIQGEEEAGSENLKFLSLQKFNITFLEEYEDQFKIQIFQNEVSLYQKTFRLNQRSKTLFPNIKRPVRLSDVIRIEIRHFSLIVRPVTFLVDGVRRGKNTVFEFWLRNKHKNKMGNLSFQYFLENMYLENEKQMRSRKAIVPNSLQYVKTLAAKKITEKQAVLKASFHHKNSEVIKKKIEQADQRILKINEGVNQIIKEMKQQMEKDKSIPIIKKNKSNFSRFLDASIIQQNTFK